MPKGGNKVDLWYKSEFSVKIKCFVGIPGLGSGYYFNLPVMYI